MATPPRTKCVCSVVTVSVNEWFSFCCWGTSACLSHPSRPCCALAMYPPADWCKFLTLKARTAINYSPTSIECCIVSWITILVGAVCQDAAWHLSPGMPLHQMYNAWTNARCNDCWLIQRQIFGCLNGGTHAEASILFSLRFIGYEGSWAAPIHLLQACMAWQQQLGQQCITANIVINVGRSVFGLHETLTSRPKWRLTTCHNSVASLVP